MTWTHIERPDEGNKITDLYERTWKGKEDTFKASIGNTRGESEFKWDITYISPDGVVIGTYSGVPFPNFEIAKKTLEEVCGRMAKEI